MIVSRNVAHKPELNRRLKACGLETRADWHIGIWWATLGLWHAGGWEEPTRTGTQHLGIEGDAP